MTKFLRLKLNYLVRMRWNYNTGTSNVSFECNSFPDSVNKKSKQLTFIE